MELQRCLSSANRKNLTTLNGAVFLIAALAMSVAQASVESSSSLLPPTTTTLSY